MFPVNISPVSPKKFDHIRGRNTLSDVSRKLYFSNFVEKGSPSSPKGKKRKWTRHGTTVPSSPKKSKANPAKDILIAKYFFADDEFIQFTSEQLLCIRRHIHLIEEKISRYNWENYMMIDDFRRSIGEVLKDRNSSIKDKYTNLGLILVYMESFSLEGLVKLLDEHPFLLAVFEEELENELQIYVFDSNLFSGKSFYFLNKIVCMLILENGEVNTGAAYVFCTLFQKMAPLFSFEHQEQILAVLEQFATHEEIHVLFGGQIEPAESMKETIRLDLKLAEAAPVTHVELARAALLSTLYDLRQSDSEGNCYAIAPLIMTYFNDLKSVLEKTISLLQKGTFDANAVIQLPLAPLVNSKPLSKQPLDDTIKDLNFMVAYPSFQRIEEAVGPHPGLEKIGPVNVREYLEINGKGSFWALALYCSFGQNRVQQMLLAWGQFIAINRLKGEHLLSTPKKKKGRLRNAKAIKTTVAKELFVKIFFDELKTKLRKHGMPAGKNLILDDFINGFKHTLSKVIWIEDAPSLNCLFTEKGIRVTRADGQEFEIRCSAQKRDEIYKLATENRRFIALENDRLITFATYVEFSLYIAELIRKEISMLDQSTQEAVSFLEDIFRSNQGPRFIVSILADANKRTGCNIATNILLFLEVPYFYQNGGITESVLADGFGLETTLKKVVSKSVMDFIKNLFVFFSQLDSSVRDYFKLDNHKLAVSSLAHAFILNPSNFAALLDPTVTIDHFIDEMFSTRATNILNQSLTQNQKNMIINRTFNKDTKKRKFFRDSFPLDQNHTYTLKEFREEMVILIAETHPQFLGRFKYVFHRTLSKVDLLVFGTTHLGPLLEELNLSLSQEQLIELESQIQQKFNLKRKKLLAPRMIAQIIHELIISFPSASRVCLSFVENAIRKTIGFPGILELGDLNWAGGHLAKPFHELLLIGYDFGSCELRYFRRKQKMDSLLDTAFHKQMRDFEIYLPKNI